MEQRKGAGGAQRAHQAFVLHFLGLVELGGDELQPEKDEKGGQGSGAESPQGRTAEMRQSHCTQWLPLTPLSQQ